jgi:hypothetical protein
MPTYVSIDAQWLECKDDREKKVDVDIMIDELVPNFNI